MTAAARSYLALFAAPNSRGAGPRPPRFVLAALSCFWLAVAHALTGCAPQAPGWGDPANATAVVCVDGADYWTAVTAADAWRVASADRVDLTVVEGDACSYAETRITVHAIAPKYGRTFSDGLDIYIDPAALTDVAVYAHELGHLVLGPHAYEGHEHSPDRASLMYYGRALGDPTITITADDLGRLP